MTDKSRDRGLSIVGPFILIGVGIVLLLQQLNVIQWSLWEVAFRLWPLIIIAVGADILVARRSFLGAIASLALVLALLGGGIYLMGTGPARSGQELSSEEVAYPLDEGVKYGNIDLSFDAGKMEIQALPESSGNVLQGTLHQAASIGTSSVHVENDKVTVVLHSRWPQRFIFSENQDFLWDLSLSKRIPLDIDLSLGAGEIVADLTELELSSVDVKIGAGSLTLKLPSGSDMDVNVSIGAGSAEIQLPAGAAVTVSCTTGVGNCALPNGSGFWGQNYTSPGYSDSENKIEIQINIGVGEGEVR